MQAALSLLAFCFPLGQQCRTNKIATFAAGLQFNRQGLWDIPIQCQKRKMHKLKTKHFPFLSFSIVFPKYCWDTFWLFVWMEGCFGSQMLQSWYICVSVFWIFLFLFLLLCALKRSPLTWGGFPLTHFIFIFLSAKLTKRSQERENLGMLVWSPNQNISEAKCKLLFCFCFIYFSFP